MSESRLPDSLTIAEREATRRALAFSEGQVYIRPTFSPKSRYEPKKAIPRPFTGKVPPIRARLKEKTARAAERKRRYPYEVIVDCNGQEIVFGDAESMDGGSAMFLAKLTPWAKNPRVRRKS